MEKSDLKKYIDKDGELIDKSQFLDQPSSKQTKFKGSRKRCQWTYGKPFSWSFVHHHQLQKRWWQWFDYQVLWNGRAYCEIHHTLNWIFISPMELILVLMRSYPHQPTYQHHFQQTHASKKCWKLSETSGFDYGENKMNFQKSLHSAQNTFKTVYATFSFTMH